MKRLFSLSFFLIILTSISAQDFSGQYVRAQQEICRRGEVYFSFQLTDHSQLSILTKKVSISNVIGNSVFAYANKKEFSDFIGLGYDYEVHTAPSELFQVKMTNNPKQVLTWNYYPTYPAYEALMQDFANDHPQICKLLTITTLASGRKILGLRITDNVNNQENEPEFLYSSSIHGDETTGYILLLHLADYLLTGYGTDERITNMVNNVDIVICPLANPDGTYKGGNNSVNGATRGNANNIDLNRNYPDPKGGPHPDGNAWQPETVAFMNFAGFNSFTMGANFHGGTEVLNYPWDTWSKLTADDAWWIYTSRGYADTVHEYAPSNYFNEYNNGITNGNAWYEIEGGRQDYMNYFRNCRESTLEISDTKLLPESQLIAHWDYNYRSMLDYIEQSGFGLHGMVTDSMSGAPLNARIYIDGFDKDSSHVFTDPGVGDYHRLLKAGTYTVTYSASGYYPKTYTVQINDRQTTTLDVKLYDGRLETNFTADTNILAVDQSVHFTDQSAGYPQSWSWTFEGGSPSLSTETNPIITYSQPGTFPVKLVITRPGSIDSLVRENFIEVRPWFFIGNKTYSVCDGRFFDSGGPNEEYNDGESYTTTFYPSDPNEKLTAIFNNIEIEDGGSECANDRLLVFDGESVSEIPVARICGSDIHEQITSSDPTGALTFQFESNGSNVLSGWDITISCDSNVGITENILIPVNIYPNPIFTGKAVIESDYPIQMLVSRDLTGRILSHTTPCSKKYFLECNWAPGIYLLQIQTNGKWFSKKIQVMKL